MADQNPENGSSSESWLTGKIKAITGIVLALTALVGALVAFRDSIPWLTPVQSLEIAPAPLELDMGDKVMVTAAVKDSKGNLLKKNITWISANPDLVTVDAKGLVTAGNTAGTTTIAASVGPVRGIAQVHVKHDNVANVQIFPDSKTIQVNDQLKFDATPYDAEGNSLLGRPVRWSSENNNIVAVDESTGEASGKKPGSVKVTAVSEEKTAAATVNVEPASTLVALLATPSPAPASVPLTAAPVHPGTTVALPPAHVPLSPALEGRSHLPAAVTSAAPPLAARTPVNVTAAAHLESLALVQKISILGGTRAGQCPAAIRILIGNKLIDITSDPQEVDSLVPGDQSYELHGTVSCPGQTVAVVDGRGTVTIANQKSYRCDWRRTGLKNFKITLVPN